MGKIGIFYGSTEGNTEEVAEKVQKALGNADSIKNTFIEFQKHLY